MTARLAATIAAPVEALRAEQWRLRGSVQGVGMRPTVWRIANELGISGSVCNDSQGVLIVAVASAGQLDALARRLRAEAPPLSRINAIERWPMAPPDRLSGLASDRAPDGASDGASDGVSDRLSEPVFDSMPAGFFISASPAGTVRPSATAMTAVTADAAICAACVADIFDPFNRRFRYPLTHCTHCGPRLSFVTGVPYDRARTTMAGYPMCAACQAEYAAPADRRFHAQPIACHACGPRVTLKRLDGRAFTLDSYTFLDDCDAAGTLLARGQIVAIKGLGGYQLACDATQPAAVARLRALKARERKPFALMAANVDAVRRWCDVSAAEADLLQSPAGPIVLLARRCPAPLPGIADTVAPGLATLGFMLPSTGLLHLALRRMQRPIVLTSGNLSDEPQAITFDALAQRFGSGAGLDIGSGIDFVLDHDRPITRRVDDSVVRVVDGGAQVLRRARGHAPEPISLPPGFDAAPTVLAYGGELKNTFCLLRAGQATLSPHLGDLSEPSTRLDYQRALQDLQSFFAFTPALRACDAHPDYQASRLAHQDAALQGQTAVAVLHHHAHIAACLVDNGWPLDAGPVVGVALDGLGYGDGGEWWGGEFAVADYRQFRRLGSFKPVALLGGDAAVHEPWRNTYAHLMVELKWPAFAMNFSALALFKFLDAKPRPLLDAMLQKQLNSPLASSCGRLFDAVAAAIGICREQAAYEGQGAVEMEALITADALQAADAALAYPFAIPRLKSTGLPYIEPLAMWHALLGDLVLGTPLPTMALRFHQGLANVIVKMVDKVAQAHDADRPLRTAALSGGVFQNRVLLALVSQQLRALGYRVLTHHRVPCNDGGLALGQAAVAAACALPGPQPHHQENSACA